MPGQEFMVVEFPVNTEVLRLLPAACSPSVEDGLQAATADPLWYVARQWQMGEFRASNGGAPVLVEVAERSAAVQEIRLGEDPLFAQLTDPDLPLEVAVEGPQGERSEDAAFNGAWNKSRLEYRFAVKAGDAELSSEEYASGDLDWYDFDTSTAQLTEGDLEEHAVVPSKVVFKGMPEARWWRFEDGNVDLGGVSRPDLDMIAMALVDISMVYGNDWYSLPLRQKAGSLRFISAMTVVDTFGQRTPIPPTVDESSAQSGWSLFTLSRSDVGHCTDSRLFMLADRVAAPMQGDPLEEVTFHRDEAANLVWGVEHRYLDGDTVVRRDDVEAANAPAVVEVHDDVPVYRLKSHVPRHWIPYVAVREKRDSEHTVFLRGRSDETACNKNPQYKGQLLKESRVIREEEIPAIPLRVTRRWKAVTTGTEKWSAVSENGAWRLERIDDKRVVSWIGRDKRPAELQPASNLTFDYLVEK